MNKIVTLDPNIMDKIIKPDFDEDIIYEMRDISFIDDGKEVITDKGSILKKIGIKNNYKMYAKGLIRETNNHPYKIIIECDFNKLIPIISKDKSKQNIFYYPELDLEFTFSNKFDYGLNLESLNKLNFVKKIIDKDCREYKGLDSIKEYLFNCSDNEVFEIEDVEGNYFFGTKDINLFFLLNNDIIKSINSKNTSNELKDYLLIKPKKINLHNFSLFVDSFLEEISDDYNYEFDDLIKLDVNGPFEIRGEEFEGYTKKKIQSYKYKTNQDMKILKDNILTNYIPKKIEEQ